MLKWKKKLYWRDEEDGKLYIHPIAAIGSIAVMVVIMVVILWNVIFPTIG